MIESDIEKALVGVSGVGGFKGVLLGSPVLLQTPKMWLLETKVGAGMCTTAIVLRMRPRQAQLIM